eukprot:GHVH01007565.1.p1 GENE.GHVH01007565.1~~GHVH01007565.1.p1  ORF type:complete len:318 (+),score=42.40 GHVH01007565.1:64-1017(+)
MVVVNTETKVDQVWRLAHPIIGGLSWNHGSEPTGKEGRDPRDELIESAEDVFNAVRDLLRLELVFDLSAILDRITFAIESGLEPRLRLALVRWVIEVLEAVGAQTSSSPPSGDLSEILSSSLGSATELLELLATERKGPSSPNLEQLPVQYDCVWLASVSQWFEHRAKLKSQLLGVRKYVFQAGGRWGYLVAKDIHAEKLSHFLTDQDAIKFNEYPIEIYAVNNCRQVCCQTAEISAELFEPHVLNNVDPVSSVKEIYPRNVAAVPPVLIYFPAPPSANDRQSVVVGSVDVPPSRITLLLLPRRCHDSSDRFLNRSR